MLVTVLLVLPDITTTRNNVVDTGIDDLLKRLLSDVLPRSLRGHLDRNSVARCPPNPKLSQPKPRCAQVTADPLISVHYVASQSVRV